MDKPLARSPYSVLLHVPNRGPVLFDTLSGSLVGLDSRAERAWTTDINMFTPEEISTLEKRGHLVDGLSFDKMLDNLSESYAKSMPNKSIFYIVYSLSCNFECPYCFESGTSNPKLLTSEELAGAFSAITEIIRINETEDNEIVLFGGEPLLDRNRDLISATMHFARSSGIKVSAITNGSGVLRYSDVILKNRDILGVFSITVDGSKSDHDSRRVYRGGGGSYEDVIAAIKFLRKNGLPVSIRMNLDKSLKDGVDEAILQLEDRLNPLPEIVLSLVDDTSCNGRCSSALSLAEATEELLDLGYFDGVLPSQVVLNAAPINHISSLIAGSGFTAPRFQHCRFGDIYLFSTNDAVYCCPRSCENDELMVGRFYPDVSIIRDRLDAFHAASALSFSTCRGCPWSPICGGGCYIKRLNLTKSGYPACPSEDIKRCVKLLVQHHLGDQ